MNKTRVLMLGWDIAPYVNGGLGVACHGMCKALSEKVDITLILPKITNKTKFQNISVVGISKEQVKKSIEEHGYQDIVDIVETKEINVNLDPYFEASQKEILQHYLKQKIRKGQLLEKIEELPDFLSDTDVFGENVIEKVILYANEVQKLAANIQFDVIHAHDWMTFLAGIYVKNEFRKPLILHVHSLDYDRVGAIGRSWVFNIEKYAFSRADLVIPVSNYTAGIIYSRYGLSSKKVLPVHNGIDEISHKVPKHNNKIKVVLFVGRMTGQKGPEYFLEIAQKVNEQYKNVKFLMAGAANNFTEFLNQEKFLDIKNKVEILGFVNQDNLYKLYSKSDVLCMPSVSEPFGMAALEAAQFGLPIVITTRSGVSEILTGALKADFWDIDQMADYIIRLFKDKKFYLKVSESNKKDVQQATWFKTAEKILGAYDKVMNEVLV